MPAPHNTLHLSVKELRSLRRDPILVGLIVFSFSVQLYWVSTAVTETLIQVPIAVVDEDRSQISDRIVAAFDPPWFRPALRTPQDSADQGMDHGRYTFTLGIPPDFQRDVLAGRRPAIQLNADATLVKQAYVGVSNIQEILAREVNKFVRGEKVFPLPVELGLRNRFNPELTPSWFAALTQIIDQITLLSIILTGAALLREREHGTVEHLLVMPVTPFQIMFAKVLSMGLVVLVASALSLMFVVQGLLAVPVQGSVLLFFVGVALHLFATTSLGIFLGTFARSMPQFGLLMILIIIPMQILSGGVTPRESMPEFVQNVMLAAPTTHFVMLGQSILFRGAGLDVVWPQFAALALIGATIFAFTLKRFRKTLSTMA